MAFGEEAITAERNVGVGYGVPPVRQDYGDRDGHPKRKPL